MMNTKMTTYHSFTERQDPVAQPTTPAGLSTEKAGKPLSTGRFTIDIVADFATAKSAWLAIGSKGFATIYQNYEWQKTWAEVVSQPQNNEVLIAIGYDENDPVFVLPFEVNTRLGVTQATWLGGKHANYKMGIYAADRLVEIKQKLPQILRLIAQNAPHRIDVFSLDSQPTNWDGMENPMCALPHQNSLNHGSSVTLSTNFDEVIDRKSGKRKRKNLRRQLRQLDVLGGFEVKSTQNSQETKELFKVYLQQKESWFSERGIPNPFEPVEVQEFFERLSEIGEGVEGSPHLFQMEYLEADGEILALVGSGSCSGQHFGYFTSIHNDPKYSPLSPGAFLFHKVMEKAALSGLRRFDFGMGAARYKASWCDQSHSLIDVVYPVTSKGHLAAAMMKLLNHAKKTAKTNDHLWKAAKSVRSILNR